jgi:hypothetical protein
MVIFEKWNAEKTIGVWVVKVQNKFKWFGITPSSNPGSGTGAKTFDAAVKTAEWQFKQWCQGFAL